MYIDIASVPYVLYWIITISHLTNTLAITETVLSSLRNKDIDTNKPALGSIVDMACNKESQSINLIILSQHGAPNQYKAWICTNTT